MLARLSLALAVSAWLFAPQSVAGSPITYDFTGSFEQPINGSNEFSGTFTIDSNPSVIIPIALPTWDSGGVGENGANVSLTVTMGGQTIHFVNTPQSPENATFQAGVIGSGVTGPSAPPRSVNFSVQGTSVNSGSMFTLTFSHPGTDLQLADVANLDSPSFTASVKATGSDGGPADWTDGSLTSIERVSTPEPGTMAIFAVLALAGVAHRLVRGS